MNILSPQFIPWRWLRPKADRISVTLAGQATPLAGNADVKASADGATTAATAGANETSTPTATASP
jgi:hypothetical protein